MLKPIGGGPAQEPAAPQPQETSSPMPPPAAPSGPQPPSSPVGYQRPALYDDEPLPSKKPLVIGLGLGALALAAIAFGLFKPEGTPAIPTAWTPFKAADGSFACEAPEGWSVQATGSAAGAGKKMAEDNGVQMDSGGAHVEVSMSSVAGLLTGQLLFGKDTTPEAMTGSRANGVFTFQRRGLKKRFASFEDMPISAPDSEMASVSPGGLTEAMGAIGSSSSAGKALDALEGALRADVKIAEFTGKKTGLGLGRPVQGIRACIGGRDLIASVVCWCPPKDYPRLKPAFLRIVSSVAETREPEIKRRLGAPGMGNIEMR